MNLRALLQLLGLRPAPRQYGFAAASFDLPTEGVVQLAQWHHPLETPKTIRQDVVDHLRTFLRAGDVVIDIGAHTGDTAVPMALAVGSTGVVFALEPNPYVFPVLAENARLNPGKAVIVPLNFAATATAGPLGFSYSDSGFCNGGELRGVSRWRHAHPFTLTVRGENLEAYLTAHHPEVLGRVRFVKVDAEGADLDVLKSLSAMIARERPRIRAEVHKLMPLAVRRELVGWLDAKGYRVHRVTDDTCYRGPLIEDADLVRLKQFDIFAEPHSSSS